MAVQRKAIRGVESIISRSGRIDQTSPPCKIYMKIACLEMEKARRGREAKSASSRIRDIESRFREIEAETSALLQAVEQGTREDSGRTFRPAGRGFKIRY
ncbi:MAG: hypothetical protein HY760_01285 [Nitrospirae bacterium]|nr:hypothetical protein [Nitrospirota bacterium]